MRDSGSSGCLLACTCAPCQRCVLKGSCLYATSHFSGLQDVFCAGDRHGVMPASSASHLDADGWRRRAALLQGASLAGAHVRQHCRAVWIKAPLSNKPVLKPARQRAASLLLVAPGPAHALPGFKKVGARRTAELPVSQSVWAHRGSGHAGPQEAQAQGARGRLHGGPKRSQVRRRYAGLPQTAASLPSARL